MQIENDFPRFDPSRFTFERASYSTTQGAVAILFDGKKIIAYGDDPVLIRPADGGPARYESMSDGQLAQCAKSLWEEGHPYERIAPLWGGKPYVAADGLGCLYLSTVGGIPVFVRKGRGLSQIEVYDLRHGGVAEGGDGRYIGTLDAAMIKAYLDAGTNRIGRLDRLIPGDGASEVEFAAAELLTISHFFEIKKLEEMVRRADFFGPSNVERAGGQARLDKLRCEFAALHDYMAIRGQTAQCTYALRRIDQFEEVERWPMPGMPAFAFRVDEDMQPERLLTWTEEGGDQILDVFVEGSLPARPDEVYATALGTYRAGQSRSDSEFLWAAAGVPLLGDPKPVTKRAFGMGG